MTDKAMLNTRWDAGELIAARPKELREGNPEVLLHSVIASYELGDLLKCAMYKHWGMERGYIGEAGLALGDLVTQLRMLAANLDIGFWGAMRDGEDRYMERMDSFRGMDRVKP